LKSKRKEIKTMNNNKRKTLWITRTAVFIALLVVLQAATASLGNTIVTGAVVNMLLIIFVMTCGMMSGLCVAVISPVMAKLIGIGPLWSLIPFIIAGNITLILTWHSIGNRHWGHKHTAQMIALVVAATGKFLILYIGVAQIAVPLLLGLPEPQASVISNMFSIPQLLTALLGGGVALLVLSPLKKAFEGGRW
jgi:uncharacterized membrane protein